VGADAPARPEGSRAGGGAVLSIQAVGSKAQRQRQAPAEQDKKTKRTTGETENTDPSLLLSSYRDERGKPR